EGGPAVGTDVHARQVAVHAVVAIAVVTAFAARVRDTGAHAVPRLVGDAAVDALDLGALARDLVGAGGGVVVQARAQIRIRPIRGQVRQPAAVVVVQADFLVVGDHRLQIDQAVDALAGRGDAAQDAADVGHGVTLGVGG